MISDRVKVILTNKEDFLRIQQFQGGTATDFDLISMLTSSSLSTPSLINEFSDPVINRTFVLVINMTVINEEPDPYGKWLIAISNWPTKTTKIIDFVKCEIAEN